MITMIMAIVLAFLKWDGSWANPIEFVALDNFARLFHDKKFNQALINTVHYVAVTVPFQTILSLVIAAFLSSRLRNRLGNLIRSMMFVPVVASLVASASVWNVIYETNGGILNQLLEAVGIPGFNWLGRKSTALNCVAAVAIWKNVGYFLVIFYAGIMNISTDINEAALVDGATPIQRFWYITLPILKPITYMVVTLGIIWSFQVFDLVYKMTAGGPGRATYTVAYLIYSYAFKDRRIGYAAALAVCLLIVILIIHALQNLVFNDKDNDEPRKTGRLTV